MAKEKEQEGAVTDVLSVPKARVLAEVFAPNGKIRVELLPEGAGGIAEGGSVDLQPLEKRVAALEAKPEAEHVDLSPLTERVEALERKPNGGGAPNAFLRGNYDRSKYNRTVTEEEVEKMLRDGTAPEHSFDREIAADNLQNLPDYMRAACCVYECPTAEKVILKGGVEFVRLSNKEPLQCFCNTTTLEVFVFSDAGQAENSPISAYPYNLLTKEGHFHSDSPFLYSVSNTGYTKVGRGELNADRLRDVLNSEDPVGKIRAGLLNQSNVQNLSDYITSERKGREKYEGFLLETISNERYMPLTPHEQKRLFKDEECVVFKNVLDGTLYKMGLTSKQYDASEVEFSLQDAKYFKGELLGQIPGIPGTYTIREDFYADMRETLNMIVRVSPTTPKPLEPVADQIKKLLGLS